MSLRFPTTLIANVKKGFLCRNSNGFFIVIVCRFINLMLGDDVAQDPGHVNSSAGVGSQVQLLK